ncbi:MAG: hypothetical protein WD898_04130 [Candidatus Paceibacterota bacterium]
MKEFVNARFFVPPIVGALFVFFADPRRFLVFVKEHDYWWPIVIAPIFVFGIGFLVSTFVTTLIDSFKKRITLSQESFGKSIELFPYLEGDEYKDTKRELATWLVLKDQELEYIRNQVDKRWHAFNASANSLVVLILVHIWAAIESVVVAPCLWWIAFLVSSIAFCLNARENYRKVAEIDNVIISKAYWEYKKRLQINSRDGGGL